MRISLRVLKILRTRSTSLPIVKTTKQQSDPPQYDKRDSSYVDKPLLKMKIDNTRSMETHSYLENMDAISALTETTKNRLHLFDSMRGKTTEPGTFWDIVVLTASDTAQKKVYEMQLKKKCEAGHLPLSASYAVVADPPGYKIGNGGSTMVVIKELYEQYKEKLWEKKIIILHAGGFSQRLPNASLLGKAFTPLPIGNPMYQALEIKLASYIHFPEKICGGGIFVACCDTTEVYDDQNIPWSFSSNGFTALAHLSPLSIGTTHGVFVLDAPVENSKVLWNCQRFLHKPPIAKMHSTKNCIVRTNPEEMVLTDSAYFFSATVAKELLHFYDANLPLNCEIDAYGDFLQALGSRSTSEYVNDQKNVCFEADSLQLMRTKIYNLLHKCPLHAVVLAPIQEDLQSPLTSIFFHIGTMPEYRKCFTEDEDFRRILGVNSLISCNGIPQKFTGMEEKQESLSSTVQVAKHGAMKCSIGHLDYRTPCIMGSVLHSNVKVGEGTVIEYCYLNVSATVGSDCIVSNCILPSGSTVQNSTFMHTVAVNSEDGLGYVTVIFGNDDDLKRSVEDFSLLTYFGCSLANFFVNNFNTSYDKKLSLWTVKLFPACESMEESGEKACKALSRISEHKKSGEKVDLYAPTNKLLSMKDILEQKNAHDMLEFRMKLQDYVNSVTRSSHLNHIEALAGKLDPY